AQDLQYVALPRPDAEHVTVDQVGGVARIQQAEVLDYERAARGNFALRRVQAARGGVPDESLRQDIPERRQAGDRGEGQVEGFDAAHGRSLSVWVRRP